MLSSAMLLDKSGKAFRRATLEEFTRGLKNSGRKVSVKGVIYFLQIAPI